MVLSLLYSPEVKGCIQHSSRQVLYLCGAGLCGRQIYPRPTDNYPAQRQSLLGPLSLHCHPGLLLPVPGVKSIKEAGRKKEKVPAGVLGAGQGLWQRGPRRPEPELEPEPGWGHTLRGGRAPPHRVVADRRGHWEHGHGSAVCPSFRWIHLVCLRGPLNHFPAASSCLLTCPLSHRCCSSGHCLGHQLRLPITFSSLLFQVVYKVSIISLFLHIYTCPNTLYFSTHSHTATLPSAHKAIHTQKQYFPISEMELESFPSVLSNKG